MDYEKYFVGDDRNSYIWDIGSWATRNMFYPYLSPIVLEIGPGMNRISDHSITLDIAGNPDIKVDIGQPYKRECQFRTIIMSHVLEHVKDDFTAIRNCYDMLEVGGKLIVLSPAHKTGICMRKEEPNGHVRLYTRGRVANLEFPGFPCVHFRYVHFIHNIVWNRLKYILKAINYPFRKIDGKSIYDRWLYRKLSPNFLLLLNRIDDHFTRCPGNAFFIFEKTS